MEFTPKRKYQKDVNSSLFIFPFESVFGVNKWNGTMVRNSKRKQLLKRIQDLLCAGIKRVRRLEAIGLPSSTEKEFVRALRDLQLSVHNRRYLSRGRYRRRTPKFGLCLSTDTDDSLNDEEFRFHFRVTRECFWQLHSLLKDSQVFQ